MSAMLYTTLGRNGPKVSRLGFGGMRFPMNAEGGVDRDLAIPMLYRSFEQGITYFDTAVFYCNSDSQRVFGEGLAAIRDRIIISTKNHLHNGTDDEWWARLEDSLRLLRTDHIDCYNFHGLTWDCFQKNIDGPNGKLRLMERAKREGMVRHICCSFHDSADALIKLAKTGVFQSITLQYNLLDRSLEEALWQLKDLGVGIVVMGPVGGGRLGVPSDQIVKATGGRASSTPEAALRFVLGHPAVNVALSGMSSLPMVDDNIRIVTTLPPFNRDEIAAIDQALAETRARIGVRCPACGYCQPCPAGVDIPENFRLYNDLKTFGLVDNVRKAYSNLTGNAALCTECGACLTKCPQKIPIPEMLRQVVAELDPSYDGFGAGLAVTGAASPDRLDARVTVRNLTTTPIDSMVRIAMDGISTAMPATFMAGVLPAFKSAAHGVAVHVPDGESAISGKVTTTVGSDERTRPFHIPFFIIPRGEWRRHTFRVTASALQNRDDIAAQHGAEIFLKHDGAAIDVRLVVRSQLHAPSPPGAFTGGRLELYVDMRPAGNPAPGAYGEGAEQFVVTIDRASALPLKHQRSYDLAPVYRRTTDGCIVELRLPYGDFLEAGYVVPQVIGLDLLMAVADSKGVLVGYPTFSGRSGLYANPRLFARAFLL